MNATYNKRLFGVSMFVLVLVLSAGAMAVPGDYYSPTALALDGAGQYLYIAEHTAGQLQEFNTTTKTVTRTLSLTMPPTGVAISSSGLLYVTAGGIYGKVYVINISLWLLQNTIDVGHTPMSPVLNGDESLLYVCNRFDGTVSKIGTASGVELTTIDVLREPVAAAITPSSDKLVVANHLPVGPANTGNIAASVSIIDTSTQAVTNIQLPNGSTGMRDICVSPDGSYAYVTHVLGRYQVPTSQLERGWIMTNAFSVIDISSETLVNTVLVDDVEMGAANPWGIACTNDGSYLCITHSGSHELSVIDRPGLHNRLSNLPYAGGFSDDANDVPHDLGFMSGLRTRIQLAGNSPRGLDIFGNTVYIAEYFSDSLSIVDITTKEVTQTLLGPQVPPEPCRLGQIYYYDAKETFQKWLSCNSCHPDARSDALNWDLANDGYGSPRNAKSHLYSHMTPPTNITGCRPDAFTSVRAGFKFIEFAIRPEEAADAVDDFMMSLEPVPSPYLVNGQMSDAAKRGKTIFETTAQCSTCHSGQYYTDMQLYDVGTGRGSGEDLDTPTLSEVWRTGPYLQNGCATTMLEVLTTYNPSNQHGVTSGLTEQELNDLSEYVLSLGTSLEPCIGDFQPDGVVDIDDAKILAMAWLSISGGPNWNHVCDISDPNDLKIDGQDFAVFSANWLCP
jgi:DNA-binding beta-propeller fold protein YncE